MNRFVKLFIVIIMVFSGCSNEVQQNNNVNDEEFNYFMYLMKHIRKGAVRSNKLSYIHDKYSNNSNYEFVYHSNSYLRESYYVVGNNKTCRLFVVKVDGTLLAYTNQLSFCTYFNNLLKSKENIINGNKRAIKSECSGCQENYIYLRRGNSSLVYVDYPYTREMINACRDYTLYSSSSNTRTKHDNNNVLECKKRLDSRDIEICVIEREIDKKFEKKRVFKYTADDCVILNYIEALRNIVVNETSLKEQQKIMNRN